MRDDWSEQTGNDGLFILLNCPTCHLQQITFQRPDSFGLILLCCGACGKKTELRLDGWRRSALKVDGGR